jgi:cytochrome c oxidase subunit IV
MASASERRTIVLGALGIWAALFLLGAASLAYALIPGLPLKLPAALVVVVLQAALVLGGFMRLGKASALVRTTAAIGIVWLSFLFLMSFADLWTR